MELVHLDYLTIEATEGGKDAYILIMMDHFTRYAQALVATSQTVKCTSQALWDRFIIHYGLPELSLIKVEILIDLTAELCKVARV